MPPLKLLLVEDNPGDARLIQEFLREIGRSHDVHQAVRLSEAVALVKNEDFDLALVDLGLPDSSGPASATTLIATAPDLPVVVLTGQDDDQVAEAALRAGAQDYLYKGRIDAPLLDRTLRYALDRQHFKLQLREREAQFKDFADVASDWLWETDGDLRLTFLTGRFAEMTGRSLADTLGKRWEDVLVVTETLHEWLTALGAHRPFRHIEAAMTSHDDELVWVHLSGRPMFDGEGQFRGYRGAGSDITALIENQRRLKENEERLTRYIQDVEYSRQQIEEQAGQMVALAEDYAMAKERAERADRAKSEFLATMSHEIRTPLGGVLGMADLLLEAEVEGEERKYVQAIHESAETLLSIINDILDLSKIEAGRLKIEAVDFNLDEVVGGVEALLRRRAEGKGVRLVTEISDGTPRRLIGDPLRLRQILFNLVGNAIKFTDRGSVVVRINHQHDGDQILLRCEVIDTGIGIAVDAQPELFTRFNQAEISTSRKYGGTGLGLAICKQLAELMGGSIGVASAPGKGSTFWFTLKCRLGAATVPQAGEGGRAAFAVIRSLSILVAEDNRINQMLILTLLGRLGHRVEMVGNGALAVDAAKKGGFDLVLMDGMMPEMDGVTASREIRILSGPASTVPIIALTADAAPENRHRYLGAGMNEVVAKPIDRIELLEAINRVLGQEIHKRT